METAVKEVKETDFPLLDLRELVIINFLAKDRWSVNDISRLLY
jgi:hypothetical protein